MSGPGPIITCACCQRSGPHYSRRLLRTCHSQHQKRGELDKFPRVTQPAEPWYPTGPHGRRMLQRYRELAALRPRPSIKRIAFELGVTERSVWRYAAAIRAEQATPETTDIRSDAAA